jgi:anaerobic magnesium-protoporphyrin IX monomethyl ester cyclase
MRVEKMDVIMLGAPVIYTEKQKKTLSGQFFKINDSIGSLGLTMLASVIEKENISTRIFHPKKLFDIEKIVRKYNPKVIGVSSETVNYPIAAKIPSIVNNIDKNIFKVIGGHHVTFCDEGGLKDGYDCVVRGEGEAVFLELVRAILNGKSAKNIKGISFLKNGKIVRNPSQPLILNLDELPFPNWTISDLRPPKYLGVIYGTRGCPYHCKFCVTSEYYKKTSRCRSAESIVLEILEKKYRAVYFQDDDFTNNEARIVELHRLINEYNLNLDLIVYSRMDTIARNPRLGKLLSEMGTRLAYFGIESLSEEGLGYVGKSLLIEDQKRSIEIMKDVGIEIWASIMVLPTDTEKTWKKTVTFTKENINPKISTVAICTPFPGTELYREFNSENRLLHKDWRFYDGLHCVFQPLNTSAQKLEEMHIWGDKYLNDNIPMKYTLKFLKFLPESLRYALLLDIFKKRKQSSHR